MSTLTITAAIRQQLKARAHGLNPVVMIGDAGLTEAVLKEMNVALNAHELIKIRVAGDDRTARVLIYQTICDQLKAIPIQHIGKLLVVYRPAPPASQIQAGSANNKARTNIKNKTADKTTKTPRRTMSSYTNSRTTQLARPPRTARVRASGQRSAKKAFQTR